MKQQQVNSNFVPSPPSHIPQKAAAQRGLRVTFDLSSDILPQTSDSNVTTEFDPESLTQEDRSISPTPSANEILYNQNGQQVQRFVLDGVEILIPLPPSENDATDDLLSSEVPLEDPLPTPNRKRK